MLAIATDIVRLPLYQCVKGNGRWSKFPNDFMVVEFASILKEHAEHPRIASHHWNCHRPVHARTVYGRRKVTIEGEGSTLWLHRVIYELAYGSIPETYTIDHIDRDGRNNLPENLRLATFSEQQANQGLHRTSSTGYKGVSEKKPNGTHRVPLKRWGSAIATLGYGVQVYLGYYHTREEAAYAYNVATKVLFKKFAAPNKIPDGSVSETDADRIRAEVMRRLEGKGVL